MKSVGIKIISMVLSLAIVFGLLSFGPVSIKSSAICCRKDYFDKSKYTLTGDMAHDVAMIAKSQKGRTCDDFGYSGVDYGAWCDEFVADCIENAGGDSSIVAHGGTVADFESKMRERGAKPVTNPQEGDLIFFTYSHVEIVTKVENGVVYCAGGNNTGNLCKGERKASGVGSARLYLRPNYPTTPTDIVPPTWATLTANKSSLPLGDSITFTMDSDTAKYYNITILRSINSGAATEQSKIELNYYSNTYTFTPTKEGDYTAYISAYNEVEPHVDGNSVKFTVYGSPTLYYLTYNVNGGTNAPANQMGNGRITISSTKPTRSGYSFLGWSLNISATSASYKAGDTITLTENTTLYAVWQNNEVVMPPVFENTATIAIKNNNGSKTINYGETIILTAIVTEKPADATIAWYVDGVKKGEGETFNVNFESGTKNVEVKLVDANGNVIKNAFDEEIKDTENITVKAGFFQKLISFFKNLFGMNRTVIQTLLNVVK